MNLLSNSKPSQGEYHPPAPSYSKRGSGLKKAVFAAVLGVYVFSILFAFFGINPKQAQAEDYATDSFQITTKTIINGKPDNLVKVVNGQPIRLQISLTISSPPTGIVLNSDSTRVEFRYFPGKGQAVAKIKEVGLGIESPYEGLNTCEVMTNYTGSNYEACDFDGGRYIIRTNQLADGKTIPAGREFLFNVTLDASKVSQLGMDRNKQNNVAYFRVQPYFLLDFPWQIDFDNNISFAGKDVYVQFFANQTDLQNASTTRPNIPGYGDITANPTAAGMGDLAKFISNVFVFISQQFIHLTYSVFSNLVSPMLEGVLSIHTYTDEFVNVIYPGWEVLRNVVNIYFIIAIIAIALGTLFRVESYKTKHLLVQLIIAALTVNFSLVIGQAVLGVADTVQNQFLPNNVQVIRQLGADLMPNEIKDIIVQSKFAEGSLFATASASLFFLSLAFGSFVVFAAILIFLVIRIVMLWILLMLSPLAYAAGVLPATANLRGQWWQNFLKYAFFTPIMAFFLNMAAIIAVNYEYVFRDINRDIASTAKWGGFATLVFAVASNVLLLVFLFAAVNIAQKMGIFGADVMDKIFKAGVFAPFVGAGAVAALGGKGAGAAGSAIGRAYTKWTTKNLTAADKSGKKVRANLWRAAQFLNFKVAKEAWKARAHEKEEEAYMPAIGHVRDTISRIIPTEYELGKHGLRLGRKTFFGRVGQQQLIYKKEKEYENADLSEEEKVEAYLGARHPEDKEGIRRLLIKGRHEDGLQILQGLEKRRKKADELTQKYIGEGLDKDAARSRANSEVTNPDSDSYVAAQYDSVEDLYSVVADFEHEGYTPEQIGEILAHLDELGEADTKLRAIGNAVYEFDGRFRSASEFKGYGLLEKAKGKTAVLNELMQTGIFDIETNPDGTYRTDEEGNFVFKGKVHDIKDKDGNIVKVRRSLFFDGQEITGYDDLQKVVKNTAGASKKEGKNFKYELTGARKQLSAQKRVERGDSEKWGSALEPAAFLVQDADGEFKEFTSYGRRLFQKYSPANVNAFRRSRRLQARIIKAAGLYKDEKSGKLQIDKIGSDKLALMAEGFDLNEDLEDAIIERAELQEDDAIALREKINAYMSSPEAKAKFGSKKLQFKSYFNRQTMKYSITTKKEDEPDHIAAPSSGPGSGEEKSTA